MLAPVLFTKRQPRKFVDTPAVPPVKAFVVKKPAALSVVGVLAKLYKPAVFVVPVPRAKVVMLAVAEVLAYHPGRVVLLVQAPAGVSELKSCV
jgi:hypothetical protein